MGIVITQMSDYLEFQFTPGIYRRIAHGSITQCNARQEIGTHTWYIKVFLDNGQTFKFKYSDVTSPSTSTAHELINLILTYNSGMGNKQIFYATAAQTDFTTTFTLSSNVDVYIGGVLQSTGYTWTAGSTTVIFSTPFGGGEEVIIITR